MIASSAPAKSSDALVAAYEELRRLVLGGSTFGSHFGLVVLLREGIAAWSTRGSAGRVAVRPATEPERRQAAPMLSDEVHVGLVQVLAGMALSGRGEMRR